MDKPDVRKLDAIRAERTPLENHYIDELLAGHIDRRQFLRRGSMMGMSATLLGTILAACGSSSSSSSSAASSASDQRARSEGGRDALCRRGHASGSCRQPAHRL